MPVPVEPGWLSLLPPLVAIALALIFREVVISLFAGIWLGALFLVGWDPAEATMRSVDQFIVGALVDPSHAQIILFSLLLGGMVGVMARCGGTQGIVDLLRPYATTRRRGQFMTWLSGVLIFFDDYANTLIVGNTMRPVTDRLKISREKLAYIVDSTAAPVATIALISTWIGFEISLIQESLATAAAQAVDPVVQANLMAGSENAFLIFLESIPYRFYPILAILFVLFVALSRRDFGAMRKAEARAAAGGGVYRDDAVLATDTSGGIMDPPEDTAQRWYNAVIPVAVVILVALGGIFISGQTALGAGDFSLREIVAASDPFKSLIWASFLGCVAAIALAVGQRILTTQEAIDGWLGGMRAMMLAIVILVLAWGLNGITEALGTGPYVSSMVSDVLPLWFLPLLVFIVSGVIAFATGTSWGTMAILFPVVVPLAVAMGAGVGFAGAGVGFAGAGDGGYTILLGVVSSVMSGAVFGDHCSPISDTTVMSSMASACDHIDHVRTQLPYALAVAGVGMLLGDLPTAFGFSPYISIVAGAALLYGILYYFGRTTEPEVEWSEPAVAKPEAPAPATTAEL